MPDTMPSTGNPTLDAMADDLRSFRADRDALIAAAKAAGQSAERIKQLEDKFLAAESTLKTTAARVASIDTMRGMDKADVEKFSMARCAVALYACKVQKKHATDDAIWKNLAPFERDVLQDTERQSAEQLAAVERTFGTSRQERDQYRDMVSTTDSQGAILIPTPAARNHLDYLRPFLPLAKLGAKFLSDLVGLRVPINTGTSSGVTAYWVGENANPTKSDIAFKIDYMTPKRLAARTNISNLLLRNSNGLVRSRVEADMPRAMAEALETAAIFGAGTAYTPKGLEKHILEGSYSTTIGADANTGGRFKWQTLAVIQRLLATRNVPLDPATTGLLIAPIVEQLLRTQGVEQFSGQGASNGMPIMAPYMAVPELEKVIGRYATSTIVPITREKGSSGAVLSPAIYGDWSQLNVGQWGGYRMRASDVASDGTNHAFVEDFTMLIIESEFDALPSRPEAFVEVSDCTTSE